MKMMKISATLLVAGCILAASNSVYAASKRSYIVGPDGVRNYGYSVPPHAVRSIPDGLMMCKILRTSLVYGEVGDSKTIGRVKKNEEVNLPVGLENEKIVNGYNWLRISSDNIDSGWVEGKSVGKCRAYVVA
jgi:hypothetical protein